MNDGKCYRRSQPNGWVKCWIQELRLVVIPITIAAWKICSTSKSIQFRRTVGATKIIQNFCWWVRWMTDALFNIPKQIWIFDFIYRPFFAERLPCYCLWYAKGIDRSSHLYRRCKYYPDEFFRTPVDYLHFLQFVQLTKIWLKWLGRAYIIL